jgi:hypothetical protein
MGGLEPLGKMAAADECGVRNGKEPRRRGEHGPRARQCGGPARDRAFEHVQGNVRAQHDGNQQARRIGIASQIDDAVSPRQILGLAKHRNNAIARAASQSSEPIAAQIHQARGQRARDGAGPRHSSRIEDVIAW